MVLVSNPFLDWLYFFFDFGFWLSVRNGYILYLVFVFFILLYWLIAWHPPFYLAPFFFIFGIPRFFWSQLTCFIFYFVIHSLFCFCSCCCCSYCFKSSSSSSSSSVFDRSSFVRTCKKMC